MAGDANSSIQRHGVEQQRQGGGRWGMIGRAGRIAPAMRMRVRQAQTFAERLLKEQGELGNDLVSTTDVELRVKRSAAYVRDAMKGRFSGSQWAEATTESVRLKLLFHRFKPVRMVVMGVFLGISFIEVPSWCYGKDHNLTSIVVDRYLSSTPTSGFPVMPEGATQLTELICLLFICGELFVKFRYRGKTMFWGYGWLANLHWGLAWALLALVALHVSGVVFTSVKHRENLVRAMLTGNKPPAGPTDVA